MVQKMLNSGYLTKEIDMEIADRAADGTLNCYVFHPSIFVQDIISYGSGLRDKTLMISNIQECAQ